MVIGEKANEEVSTSSAAAVSQDGKRRRRGNVVSLKAESDVSQPRLPPRRGAWPSHIFPVIDILASTSHAVERVICGQFRIGCSDILNPLDHGIRAVVASSDMPGAVKERFDVSRRYLNSGRSKEAH